jgi:putative membrane protein
MHKPFARFLIRWLVCGLGLWIASAVLGKWVSIGNHVGVVLIGGLILAVINIVIKPIVVILSLPAVLLSLGLFMIIINGLMVYLASRLYTPLHVTNFGAAILVGMVIGLVNYLVTTILESQSYKQ